MVRSWPSASLRLGWLATFIVQCSAARVNSLATPRPLSSRQCGARMHMAFGQLQQVRQRRQRARRDDVGSERRHGLDPLRHAPTRRHRRPVPPRAGRPPCDDRSRPDARPAPPAPPAPVRAARRRCPDRPGSWHRPASGARAAPLSTMCRRHGSVSVAATNQVDALLPALQQVEIGLQPIECFT